MLNIFPFTSDPEEVAYIRATRNVSNQEPTASSEGVFPAEGSGSSTSGCEGAIFIGELS